jgi:hypothetical protein
MPIAKKASKAKSKTKAKAKSAKAVAKKQPRAAKKRRSTAKPRKAAGQSKAKAALKSKAVGKSKPTAAPKARRAKAVSSAKAKERTTPKQARKSPPRRDGSGRLNPQYARDLRALSREHRNDSDDRAFFKTPRSGDDLAEELGKEAVATMTSGEDQSEHLISEEVEEERGGPFVKTRSGEEFAEGTDRSNPRDATREPFPRT